MAYAISCRHRYLGRHPVLRKSGGANMTDFSSCAAAERRNPAMVGCLGFSTAAPVAAPKTRALLALAPKPMNTD